METRMIGSLEVSVVGLGCNNFGMRIGRKETAAVVDAALYLACEIISGLLRYGAR